MVYTHFTIESWDAINMFTRPSERRGGVEDDRYDLVEFKSPLSSPSPYSHSLSRRATVHELAKPKIHKLTIPRKTTNIYYETTYLSSGKEKSV